MVLYESFRPDIAKGKAGWGQSGIFRLGRVLELRDEIVKEAGEAKAGRSLLEASQQECHGSR